MPQYNLAPFVTAPFRHTLKMMMALNPEAHNESRTIVLKKHPIWKVLAWQQELDSDETLTKAQIAQRECLSKSRMTQMFRLLNLPREALSYLKMQDNLRLIQMLSLRQLIGISRLQSSKMSEAFEAFKTVCEESL